MNNERKSWHIGFAYGALDMISKRDDIPEDVRIKCKSMVDAYKNESEAWSTESE